MPTVIVEAAGETASVTFSLVFDRSTLPAFGDYAPNHPDRAGLLPGTNKMDLVPLNPNSFGFVQITTGQTFENRMIWGEIRMQVQPDGSTPQGNKPKLKNCWSAGKDPASYSAIGGFIKCYGTGYYPWEAEDCKFDGTAWMDPDLVRPNNAPPTDPALWASQMDASVAVHGGRGKMVRCEVTGCGDGLNWVQTTPAGYDFGMELYGCWFHDLHFYRAPGASDGAHPDYVQLGAGNGLTSVGNYYGGPIKPNAAQGNPNAGWMIKREVATAGWEIKNVLSDKDFFEGGMFCINHYKGTDPNKFNDYSTLKIRNGRFIYRADGKYISAHQDFYPCYENNRVAAVNADGSFILDGLVPITRGA